MKGKKKMGIIIARVKKVITKALTRFEPVISCLLDRRFNQLSHFAVVLLVRDGNVYTNTLESQLELLGMQVGRYKYYMSIMFLFTRQAL